VKDCEAEAGTLEEANGYLDGVPAEWKERFG